MSSGISSSFVNNNKLSELNQFFPNLYCVHWYSLSTNNVIFLNVTICCLISPYISQFFSLIFFFVHIYLLLRHKETRFYNCYILVFISFCYFQITFLETILFWCEIHNERWKYPYSTWCLYWGVSLLLVTWHLAH